eukprot:CAMPEP_0181254350 /NCGR_PEP_ID=MMETSP1096-20121128/48557_1 /TAXON_ID=156174 ORGANISM="Chrysochromulina ericina, Strain CCMP281" /NCGR_SAMPLE_ID=MMETSP1096 /ASSEMBLY_ACC=CAM_ASM_000453 /LENGTH=68 /DNA_ID=CAMNT_0023352381 /DNA_START=381 /DNA_END=588 /DNA_ORIENTATION=+
MHHIHWVGAARVWTDVLATRRCEAAAVVEVGATLDRLGGKHPVRPGEYREPSRLEHARDLAEDLQRLG